MSQINLIHYCTTSLYLEKAMAPHSSTLAWKIPWTEEPGWPQSMGSLGVRHDWVTSLSCIGEGKGNPLQCSCLENPRDMGAWWAAVSGVTQSRTWLKWLSSSSSSSSSSSLYLSLKIKQTTTQDVGVSLRSSNTARAIRKSLPPFFIKALGVLESGEDAITGLTKLEYCFNTKLSCNGTVLISR